LETNQKSAGVDSGADGIKIATDGSVTIFFGPVQTKNNKNNWIQTVAGKGFNVILRIFGPEQAWFDKNWKPGDLKLVK